jgi:hypothetical protein
MMPPEDLGDVIRFTQQHCTAAGPFDVALEGRTDGATPDRGAKHLARYVQAGARTRTRNAIQRSMRCLGERGFAQLTQRWPPLQHITASPSKSATSAASRKPPESHN